MSHSEEEGDWRRADDTLRQAGVADTLEGLVNSGRSYPEAVPVLLTLLSDETLNWRVKESVARALTVKEARGKAAKALVREFLSAKIPGEVTQTWLYKWTIGNALSVVADDGVFEDLVRISRDKRHGRAREMVAVALGRMRNPRAVDALLELLDDEEVAGHAIIALGNLRSPKSRGAILPFLDDPKPWIQTQARRALRKIDHAAKPRMQKRR